MYAPRHPTPPPHRGNNALNLSSVLVRSDSSESISRAIRRFLISIRVFLFFEGVK